jgi:Flp pilus assembly protein TadD
MRAERACARARRLLSRTVFWGLVLVPIMIPSGAGLAQIRGPFGTETNPARSHSAETPSTSFSGRVVAGGKPLSGVMVQLENPATGMPVAGDLTDAAGQFKISGLQPGEYILVAEYQTQTVRDRISIAPLQPEMEINFPVAASASSSVSVAELQVPEKARSRLRKAEQALARNDMSRAQQQLNEALQLAPRYAAALTLRGVVQLSAGETAAAINDFDYAIHSDPGYPYAYFAMGAALNQLSRYSDARRAAEQGLRLEPQAWQGHFEVARALLGEGRSAPALEQLDEAKQTAPPTFAQLHLLRGTILLNVHRYRESAQELQEYLKLNPNAPGSEHVRELLRQVETQEKGTAKP